MMWPASIRVRRPGMIPSRQIDPWTGWTGSWFSILKIPFVHPVFVVPSSNPPESWRGGAAALLRGQHGEEEPDHYQQRGRPAECGVGPEEVGNQAEDDRPQHVAGL